MTKTVLITGASSGFGKAAADYFLARGWNVLAAMRRPDPAVFPGASARLAVPQMDVTDADSVAAAVAEGVARFGAIDAVVNNAGVGVVGAFEATPMSHIRKVFETNAFGVMTVCQAVIPHLRARRSGVIVNVTSSVTLAPMPLAAAYTASKQAVEGFTGSLALELGAFNVRVKLVEPGYCPDTRFAQNADVRVEDMIPPAYADFAAPIFAAYAAPALTTKESDVAEAIWSAVHDLSAQLRFPAGADAAALYQSGGGA